MLRALLTNPKMIVLEEPTEGIQPNIVEESKTIVIRLNRERGLTTIFVEQSIALARQASQHFVIMEKGRAAVAGATADLTDAT